MFHFDFYKKRYWFFGLSALLIVIGILFSMPFAFGVKLDIQFKGGSILKYTHADAIDLEKAGQVAGDAIGVQVNALEVNDWTTKQRSLVLNVSGEKALDTKEQAAIAAALKEAFPDQTFAVSEVSTVDPFLGREFLLRGLYAIVLASILIVLYVAFRFRTISGFSAGVMALVALVHDVLMVFGTFVVARIALNDALVAVVLTILGFSINDTIVIYDRIRENTRLTAGKMPLPELVNLSINQSITRSLNTSLATFTAITIAYVFAALAGIESIKDFALPMMVGTISGSYSTIFIAGPLWVMWKTRKGAHHAPVAPVAPPPAPAVASGSSSKGAKAKA